MAQKSVCLNNPTYIRSNSYTTENVKTGWLERLKDGLSEVGGKTIQYYTYIFGSDKLNKYCSKHLKYYDYDEVQSWEGCEQNSPVVKKVKEGYHNGKILGAIEAFWGNYNIPSHTATKTVYKKLGGRNHPIGATLGAFGYSGVVLHCLNPLAIPVYGICIAISKPEAIPFAVGLVTASYLVAGIPVAISKTRTKQQTCKDPCSMHLG